MRSFLESGRLGALARTGRSQHPPNQSHQRNSREIKQRKTGGAGGRAGGRAAPQYTYFYRIRVVPRNVQPLQESASVASGTSLDRAVRRSVTAVINATTQQRSSARPAHARSRCSPPAMASLGALREDLIDTAGESARTIRALAHTPGGASVRAATSSSRSRPTAPRYERLLDVLRAHDVRYFSQRRQRLGRYRVEGLAAGASVRLPAALHRRTQDHRQRPGGDPTPARASARRPAGTAVSVREAALDVAAMAGTSTGGALFTSHGSRHAGWLAAAAG